MNFQVRSCFDYLASFPGPVLFLALALVLVHEDSLIGQKLVYLYDLITMWRLNREKKNIRFELVYRLNEQISLVIILIILTKSLATVLFWTKLTETLANSFYFRNQTNLSFRTQKMANSHIFNIFHFCHSPQYSIFLSSY